MKITCPNCASSYEVAETMIGDAGRKVKCANCQKVWHATAPRVADQTAEDALVDVDLVTDTMDSQSAVDQTSLPTQAPSEQDWGMDSDDISDGSIDSGPVGAEPTPKRRKRGKVRLKGGRTGPSVIARVFRLVARVGLPAGIAAGLVLVGLAIPHRDVASRLFPDLASLFALGGLDVNVRGITFSPVVAERSSVSGLAVLRIETTMTNTDTRMRSTAPLRFALLNADGEEMFIWSIDPPVTDLLPGQTTPLSSELTAPPDMVAQVSVRFLQEDETVPGQVF